jgi:hypothetical protein
MLRDIVRRDERRDDLLRGGGGIVGVRDSRQQHDEFVATLTADRIRTPDAPDQTSGHRLQQPVANPMSQAVVHVLEPIQIEEEDGEVVAVTPGQGNRLGEPVVQQHAVGQVGQKVVLRQMDRLERKRARGADVMEHDDGADDLSGPIVDRRCGIFDRHLDPVAPHQEAVRCQADDAIELHRLLHRVARRFTSRAVDDPEDVGERPAQSLVMRPAGHPFGHGIEIGHRALEIDAEHRVAD